MSATRAPRRPSSIRPAELKKALSAVQAQVPRHRGTPEERQVVVVLGMHRSGTSLLSQVLHYLGVDMADESDHVSANNPNGFWERPDIVALHDQVLEIIGRPIASPLHSLPFPSGWWREKKVQAIKTQLRDLVERKVGQAGGWWGFKDPRTCRLLPLWWELFDALGITPHYVWAIRSPGESSASMANKNPAQRPMSPAQAEITWLAYNYDILRHGLAASPIVVAYDEWFNDPLAIGRRLLRRLDVPGFATEQELADCVHRLVRAEFRHQVEGRAAAVSAFPIAQTLFNEVRLLGADESGPNERLGSYISLIDIVFRALHPFVELLGDVPRLRSEVQEGKLAIEKTKSLEAGRVEAMETREHLTRQIAALESTLADAKAEAASKANDLERQLSALKSELAECQSMTERQAAQAQTDANSLRSALADARSEAQRTATDAQARIDGLKRQSTSLESMLAETQAKAKHDEAAAQTEIAGLKSKITAAQVALNKAQSEAADALRAAEASKSRAELQEKLGASLASERDRASRLELYSQSLLAEATARDATISTLEAKVADVERAALSHGASLREEITALQAKLAESEMKHSDLQIACDGYLARIEALKERKRAWG